MTENKRPWTSGELKVWYSEHDGKWAVTPEIPAGENFALRIATFTTEADARLFAAADALYEALEAVELWEAHLIESEAINSLSTPLMEELIEVQKLRNAALRAANPAAFDGEGE